MKKREFRIKVAWDQDFKNSYFSFDVSRVLGKSFQELQRQFKIKFQLIGTEEWDSIGHPYLNDFPWNIIQTIPKGISAEEVIDYVISTYLEKTGLSLEVSQDERNDIRRILERKSLGYRLGFLEGRLNLWAKQSIFQDLMEKIPMDSEVNAIIAFTGKLSMRTCWTGSVPERALISSRDAYVLIRNFIPSPTKTILHEIGHLFGARDIEDTSIVSVMTQNSRTKTYDFDCVNKKIIKRRINELG